MAKSQSNTYPVIKRLQGVILYPCNLTTSTGEQGETLYNYDEYYVPDTGQQIEDIDLFLYEHWDILQVAALNDHRASISQPKTWETVLTETAAKYDINAGRVFPIEKRNVSRVDISLSELKAALKVVAVAWIKENPKCTEAELHAYIATQFTKEQAALLYPMLLIYRTGAFDAGMTTANTFTVFRDFVVVTDTKALEAL